mmetsp:Transcript_44558/g.72508  ORF Transcript_44558/g.72508 Transcript_44558/m.72508 type:complete len:91 (-) Transcript_44558:619-891(-)
MLRLVCDNHLQHLKIHNPKIAGEERSSLGGSCGFKLNKEDMTGQLNDVWHNKLMVCTVPSVYPISAGVQGTVVSASRSLWGFLTVGCSST